MDTKPGAKDYMLKVSKGLLGMIPGGGIVAELIEYWIVPEQQKKIEAWYAYVNQTLDELIQQGKADKEELFADEAFQGIFQKASRAWMQNVEELKQPIVKAYFKAAVIKPLPLNKKLIFIEIIDSFTEAELLILREIYDNEYRPDKGDYMYQFGMEKYLTDKYAGGDIYYLGVLLQKIQAYKLLNYQSASAIIDGQGQMHMHTSPVGKEFVEYLSEA